ncbi:MAG TPA: SpoIIE family protein phosphatase [Bryobacteraceae bacterium]|nr:SpoIIE family protein phosphatase [Bryobacteraceae bacterium]
MGTADRPREGTPPAALIVTNPSGSRTRVAIERFPFAIGRLGDNDLVLRDGRASRHHARIVAEGAGYAIEDLQSSYGVFVNGERVERTPLRNGDRLEFGFADSYSLVFTLDDAQAQPTTEITAGGANLAKLRATLEVVRALQTSLSTDEVLAAVVEAALTVTGCERGFLLLRKGDGLEIRVARSRTGPLPAEDLRVPTRLLLRALAQRREFLSMNFDPSEGEGTERTIADMELRSVVCLPLVRIRAGLVEETSSFTAFEHTVGVLYMDSRLGAADLSAGGRELLTTLALEASTVLENARLIEELWARQRAEQELRIAREIQTSLLPRSLPKEGWFRAAGSSTPSLEVGGDCFDVRPMGADAWVNIVADVSGKGVGAAILAALLEGMFLAAPYTRMPLSEMLSRVNRFLNERTGGEQYATVFFCMIERNGRVRWANAGHPPPLLVSEDGRIRALAAGGVPIGLLEEAEFPSEEETLRSGDKLVIYSDGLTEAQNPDRQFFGSKGLREAVARCHSGSAQELHDRLLDSVRTFTAGAEQRDDVTLAVLEYKPED